MDETEYLRHKIRFFAFFENFSNHINDYNVHRLVWRIKGTLGEPIEDQHKSKMREIRSLLIINWQVMLDQCTLIERAIMELDEHFTNDGLTRSDEDRAFIKTTAMAIEDCLKRKLKKEDIVSRYTEDAAVEMDALF